MQFGEGNFLRAFADHFIDEMNEKAGFNPGSVAEGESLDAAGDRLLDYVLRVASGERTKAELHGAKEIAIFKDGVTL